MDRQIAALLCRTADRGAQAVAAGVATFVGAEVTSAAPGHGEIAADAIAPLLG